MKVPPKRKGNPVGCLSTGEPFSGLNESPSEKEGKFAGARFVLALIHRLNESPSEKEGKCINRGYLPLCF